MNRDWIIIAINFVVLLLLQIFVFNTIYLGIYLNIQIYLMFILFLPANLSGLSVLLLSALMGISVDLFSSGDLGLHMAACTAIGFVRPYLLKKTSTNDSQIEIPRISRNHFRQYAAYTGLLIFIHHLILFTLESFSFSDMFFILIRIFVSGIVNFSLIYFVRILISRDK